MVCFLLLLPLLLLSPSTIHCDRSFRIDKTRNTFLMDGTPFLYLSGSIHYRRVPRDYWDDRMKKIRACGFNTIQFYIEWNMHERIRGSYDFNGNSDVEEFIKTAMRNDLYVIVRSGPYICGERDMGGLPSWLLEDRPIQLRTSDPKFLDAVDSWYKVLFGQILKKYTYQRGGPILMFQIENEYGSYGVCDIKYLNFLTRTVTRYLEDTSVILFTTDGGANTNFIRCGYIPDILPTIDFGPNRHPPNMQGNLDNLRNYYPHGPLVNSEFYTGWLDHWGQAHQHTQTEVVAESLDWLLSKNVSVNLYMIHGGTSFGFEAGSNSPPFMPTPTSYDYDAPISEAGDMTLKYYAIKQVASKYFKIPPKIPVKNSTKEDYGKLQLQMVTPLLASIREFMGRSETGIYPPTFEDLKQSQGFVIYESFIPENGPYPDPVILHVPGIHDRGYVYINDHPVGKVTRMFGGVFDVSLGSIRGGESLKIMVENQGRIGFGHGISEYKGLGNVTLHEKVITNWTATGIALHDSRFVQKTIHTMEKIKYYRPEYVRRLEESYRNNEGQMTFWLGRFKTRRLKDVAEIPDTFIRFKNWSKGVAFINGFNLGRYWPRVGPQLTLYLPGPLLKPNSSQWNDIILFEQDQPPKSVEDRYIELVSQHEINGAVPH